MGGGTMKALAIRRYQAPMELLELPRPQPGPGDLLVRVRAASVNPVDWKVRDGLIKTCLNLPLPLTLGGDPIESDSTNCPLL